MTARQRRFAVGAALVLVVGALAAKIMFCGSPKQPTSTASAPNPNQIVARTRATVSKLALAQPASTGNLRLEGQVIDEQQQPVAGADVYLSSPGDRHATTEADGSFVFDHLVARRFHVSATNADAASEVITVRPTPTSEPVILRMHHGAKLVVHVVDDHAPLAGAKVLLDRRASATSDATGTVTFGGIGPHFHFAYITADSHASAEIAMMLGTDPGGIIERTVNMQRGAPLSGTVVGPDGASVPGATVYAQAIASGLTETAKADPSGAWHIDALAAGKYLLRATSQTYGPAPDVSVVLDGVTGWRDVVVHLAYDAQLVGTVVDGNGKPVAGATVHLSASMAEGYDEVTGPDGRFEMLGFRAGTYDLFARAGNQASPSSRLTFANDERLDVKLVIQESSIAGTVVDESGDPVAEVQVSALRGDYSMLDSGADVTDSHGHFDLGGLEPGEYVVNATWPDQQRDPRMGAGVHVNTGDRNVKLVIEKPATLTGRVLLDGVPMPNYGMQLTESPEFPFIGIPNAVASADGRFKVRDVHPGKWGLVLIGPGTARKTITDIEIGKGATVDLGDIAMAHGLRISGHVQASSGSPVQGAIVTIGDSEPGDDREPLQQWFRGTYQTTTDDAGGYLFDGVAPLVGSEFRPPPISATNPSLGSSLPSPIPDHDATIDLVLVASGGIDGVVEGFSDRFGRVAAKRTDDERSVHLAFVDGAGEFHFDGLPPGEYTVSMNAMPGEMAPSPVAVNVTANVRANAKLVMPKATVMLVVKVSGGSCSLLSLAAPGEGTPKLSDANSMAICSKNEAVFERIQPGSYLACADGTHCSPITVATAPDKQTVELRLE